MRVQRVFMVLLWAFLVSVDRTTVEYRRGLLRRRIDCRTYADYFFTFLRIKYFSNTALASGYGDSLTANGSVKDLAAGVKEATGTFPGAERKSGAG
jgi:hypothetical protein